MSMSNSAYFDSNVEMGTKHAIEVPVWEKYTLTVKEAARYFRIGENKLRRIIAENKDADFLLWNGNRPQIKRKLFEQYIDHCNIV